MAAPSVASAASLTTAQQEVDFLRGQLGTLSESGLWTSATAPKLTGIYGLLLQDLEAGVSLIQAFRRLHEASMANRASAQKILALVKAYKPPRVTSNQPSNG